MSYDQTAGKGQRDNVWQAEKGSNIAISLMFLPVFLRPEQQFYLSMAVALAVKKTVEEFSQQKVKLKWPNDIMVGDRKISGILIESVIQNSSIERCIVGIGLNVNQVAFNEISNKATSLFNISGQKFDLEKVTISLMEWLEKYYLQIKARRFLQLLEEYNASLYKLNEPVKLQAQDDTQLIAIIKGVNEEGKLMVVHEDNKEAKYFHGEVRIGYSR